MSRLSRNKGAGGERELCALLSEQFGQVIKRKLGQARESGNDADVPPFRFECKRLARYQTLYRWMAQCVKDAKPADVPVVALRADGKEWLVVMRFADWCKLAREEIGK